MIHQAPATLVGLLGSKCSPRSRVFGLQLPPTTFAASSRALREEVVRTAIFKRMRGAMAADYVFLGLGSAGPDSASFWAMANAATNDQFAEWKKRLGIVGEVNNQVFDKEGKNCSERIPGFSQRVINVVKLDEIRRMAARPTDHRVVMVATGRTKTEGIRIALETRLANVLVTSREDADRLLAD